MAVDIAAQVKVPGYQIQAVLFTGERTRVLRAIRECDQQPVVLKQLMDAFPESGALSRFLLGYEVGKRFDHPNISKILDGVGLRQQGEDAPMPTIVFEDRQGVDLFTYLKHCADGWVPVPIFLEMAIQLAEALSVIHQQQVIHKDLHPGNILYTAATGLTQITDFGLASLLSREQPALQPPERIEGVLAYLSPEQTGRMNRALDYRSDFYTLGCTFYHLLSGHPPFQAKDALGWVHAHIALPQTPLCTLRPEIPAVVSAIVDRLLNKMAEDRYQSALGLKKDLEKVRQALARNTDVPDLPLGLDDISDRLQIPQKLYGREKERERLLQGFFRAAGGKPKLLAVSGYSGIGKSALVHEVHKPIAAYGGFFCAGKFDQFQKNIPYSALQTALKGWIHYVLSLSVEDRQEQLAHLLHALGPNARVLIDFMPEFGWVLGELAPVAQLGSDETQNRFHLVFQRFIQAITRDHPLVLFIDDIQWADRGTLNLLPQLMSDEPCRLLLIVAYRDNEVDEHHPAMSMLRQIELSTLTAVALERITLGPLTLAEVATLMEDALHRPVSELRPLTERVHAKTAGNPFFISEFLKTLYTEKRLNFDFSSQRWRWDIAAIDAQGITDNVVDLMLGKMARLPAETQAMMQLAACIGSQFSLDMLAQIAGKPTSVVIRCLWPALRDGLLVPEGGDWFLGMVSPHCRFLHDRMLQAAYQSMSEVERQQTHLRVGRLLLGEREVASLNDDECFAITEHLNHARSLIDPGDESETLVQLNLRSARQAKAASVWEVAVAFAQQALDRLPEEGWQTHSAECKSLYQIKAECEYLAAQPEASDRDYEVLFKHLEDDLQRAEICATRLVQAIGRGNWMPGLQFGLQGLAYLNMPVPDDEALPAVLENERTFLETHPLKDHLRNVSALPDMTDPHCLIALRILPNLFAVCNILGRMQLREYCGVKGCNLILEHGKCDLAAVQLACWAVCLYGQARYEEAIVQGVEAKRLADCYAYCRQIANCYNIVAGMVCYLHAPLSESLATHQKGMQFGLENGEIARAAMNYCNTLFVQVSKGETLALLRENASKVESFLAQKSVFHPLGKMIMRFSQALISASPGAAQALDDEAFNAADFEKIASSFHFHCLNHYRAQLAFWCGDEPMAWAWAQAVEKHLDHLPTHTFAVDHDFFYALLRIRVGPADAASEGKDSNRCETVIKRFAELYPPNFQHKYQLLLAEKGRRSGQSFERVCSLYCEAIDSARDNQFLQFQALANELFACYLLDKGFRRMAAPYLLDALFLYQQWGCQMKVNHLQKAYPDLLQGAGQPSRHSISSSDMLSSSVEQSLDLASVMKSAQVISSELQFASLSARVLEVIMESAGGSTAALIMNLQGHPLLVARVDENRTLTVPEPPVALEESKHLPVSVVRYVLNSDETVNLGDVRKDLTFANDAYLLSRQPRSLLCVPVVIRDSTKGALYLENRLTQDAFTPVRLTVIHLLLAQAAISFENARLFSEVQQLNQTLESKVELRTTELHQAVQELRVANEELSVFSHSVSHDLRAPLRSIKGFSALLMDKLNPTLDAEGRDLLTRIQRNGSKMHDLIDGLLDLSRVQKQGMEKQTIDLSRLVADLFAEMRQRYPDQQVETHCAPNCAVVGDSRMIYSAMENLISNAWKYSSKEIAARVEFGVVHSKDGELPAGIGHVPVSLPPGVPIYFVKDNGAGFDIAHAQTLFGSFQRLHAEKEFSGTGVGLATVKRVIDRHHGYVWAFAQPQKGATFYFVIP